MAVGFQILDENKEAIDINALDVEAASFFNVEVDKERYAAPAGYGFNWYDSIGWRIAFGPENASWAEVKKDWLTDDYFKNRPEIDWLVNLVNHWESKGYTPIRLGYVR